MGVNEENIKVQSHVWFVRYCATQASRLAEVLESLRTRHEVLAQKVAKLEMEKQAVTDFFNSEEVKRFRAFKSKELQSPGKRVPFTYEELIRKGKAMGASDEEAKEAADRTSQPPPGLELTDPQMSIDS